MIRIQIEGHSVMQSFLKTRGVIPAVCEHALNSTEILEELKGFDLIVYDSPVSICGVLVAEFLDIPAVEILPLPPNAGPIGLPHMIPMPLSYVPQPLTGLTDKMTFLERVMNLGAYLGGLVFLNVAFARPMDALKVKYNIKPERSFVEAVGAAELVIITADFALEYPQPLLPGMKKSVPLRKLLNIPCTLFYLQFCIGRYPQPL